MTVLEAQFLISAARAADIPRHAAPQIALVGRSNVGKSSLINALTGRRLARTSGSPGKTRLVNLYRVVLGGGPAGHVGGAGKSMTGTLYLADLPGYGYARVPRGERGGEASRIGFARLAEEYFGVGRLKAVPTSTDSRGGRLEPAHPAAVLLVVDARHPGLASDRNAWHWIGSLGRPAAVVATKIDKLGRADRARALAEIARKLDSPVQAVSAETGEGTDDLWRRITTLVNPKSASASPGEPAR